MSAAAAAGDGGPGPVVIENCAIAAMDGTRYDDSGAEHRQRPHRGERRADHRGRGGPGSGGRAGRDAPDRRHRLPGHARAWSIPTTTCTSGSPRAARSSPSCSTGSPSCIRSGPGSSRARARGGHGRTGLAGPVRVQHQHRSPLHLPAGREIRDAVRGRGRRPGCARGGDRAAPRPSGCGSIRAGARWTSAVRQAGCRPTRSSRTPDDALAATAEAVRRFHDPSPGAMVRVAVAPCSPFTRQPAAHARDGRAGPQAGRPDAHPPGRDPRGGRVLPADARPDPGRVRRRSRLARRGRLAGALRAPGRVGHQAARRDRHVGGALPHLERAAGRGHRPGPPAAAGRCARWASASTARPPARAPRWPPSCVRRCWPRGCGTSRARRR